MSRFPTLLVLDAAYSYETVRQRSIEHSVTSRDLDGFFSRVWSVHPFVGADAVSDPPSAGPLRVIDFAPRHTIVEARVGRFRWLRRLPTLNFMMGQIDLLRYLLRLIRKQRITVIRVGDPYYLGLVGLLMARVNRIPLVIRVNGNYDAIYSSTGRLAYPRLFRRRWIEKKIDRFVLPRADLVAAANESALEYALANGARSDRATVFRYGNLIDPLHFREPAQRVSIRGELPVGERPFVACIGRLEPVKHPDDVIRSLSVAQETVPDLCAIFVGDGSLLASLRSLTTSLGLEECVFFVGDKSQDWIARCLTDAAVVAAPMAGRALVESLLSGTPVVAYDVDWHREMIEDGSTGFLVPYRDFVQLGQVLADLVSDQRDREVGSRARSTALKMMDPESTARSERQSYEMLLRAP